MNSAGWTSSESTWSRAVNGFGLGYLPMDQVEEHVKSGRLVSMPEDWCPLLSGYHLYYPSRRQHTAAFSLLVGALSLGRKKPGGG